jgi:hypothetical protein
VYEDERFSRSCGEPEAKSTEYTANVKSPFPRFSLERNNKHFLRDRMLPHPSWFLLASPRMRILVRNPLTDRYYAGVTQWVSDPALAIDFWEPSAAAVRMPDPLGPTEVFQVSTYTIIPGAPEPQLMFHGQTIAALMISAATVSWAAVRRDGIGRRTERSNRASLRGQAPLAYS